MPPNPSRNEPWIQLDLASVQLDFAPPDNASPLVVTLWAHAMVRAGRNPVRNPGDAHLPRDRDITTKPPTDD